MNEHLDIIRHWLKTDKNIALARVIKTWGSSPRPIGSVMLVNDEGKMAGSVSGGCVEGSVVKNSQQVLDGDNSLKIAYGVSDEEAWSVGLSCGGSIQVFVERIDFNESPVWEKLLQNMEDNVSSILISSLEDGGNSKTLISNSKEVIGDDISDELISAAHQAYDERTHKAISIDGRDYFIQLFPRKAQLLIIGAAHITVDLVSLGNQFGFETIVIDPRGYFTQNTTFPNPPSQLLESYPSEVLGDFDLDAYTFAAILSHDPKIDDNALEILLPSKTAYIGALGSKKTHQKRTNRLLEKGLSQELIDKISAPIGLNINARTAKEIALAIMAQIIAAQNAHLVR